MQKSSFDYDNYQKEEKHMRRTTTIEELERTLERTLETTKQRKRKNGYATRHNGYAAKHKNYKAKHPELYGCKFTRKPVVRKAKRTVAQNINETIKKLIGNWNDDDYWRNKSEEELIADLLS